MAADKDVDLDFDAMLDQVDSEETGTGGFGASAVAPLSEEARAAFDLPDGMRKSIDEVVVGRRTEEQRTAAIDQARELLDVHKSRMAKEREEKFGPQTPAVRPEDDIWGGEFMRSFGRSVVGQGPQMVGGAMRQSATSLDLRGGDDSKLLAKSLQEQGQAASDVGERLIRATPAPRVDDFRKIRLNSISDFARGINDYVQFGLGQAIGTGGMLIVGGGLGGLPGLLATSGTLGVGEMRQTLEEAGVTDPVLLEKYGWAGGAAVSALDALVPADILTDQVKRGLGKYAITRIAKTVGRVGMKEAITETMQEMVQIAGAASAAGIQIGEDRASEEVYNMGRTLFEKRWELANAAALGFIGGVGLGAPSALRPDRRERTPAPSPRLEGIASSAQPLVQSGATIEADPRALAANQEGPTPRLGSGEGQVRGARPADPVLDDAERFLTEITGPEAVTEPDTAVAQPAAAPAQEAVAQPAAPVTPPTFADVFAALPRDEAGDPDVTLLTERMAELGKRSFRELTDQEKVSVLQSFTAPAAPAATEARQEPAAAPAPEAATQAQPAATNPAEAVLTAVEQAVPGISEIVRQAVQPAQEAQTAVSAAERQRFNRVLASKERRSNWGSAANLSSTQLQALIDEAVADGRLAMRKGQPVRTPQAKTAQVTEATAEAVGATAVPMGRAAERRLEGVANDTAYKHAAALLAANGIPDQVKAVLDRMKADKKATKVALDEVYTAVAGAPKKFKTKGEVYAAIEKAVVKEPELPTAAPTERIEDAGAKIGGARKDTWAGRGLDITDLEAMSNGEQAKYVTKDGVWPKPDYAAMVAEGMPAEVAALVKLLRDGLAAKPRTDTPQGRRDYVEMMGWVRAEWSKARSVADLTAARDVILYERVGWPKGTFQRVTPSQSAQLFSIFKGRKEALRPDRTMQQKANKMAADGFPGDVEPWTKKYVIRPAFAGRGVEPKFLVVDKTGRKVVRDEFATEDEAKAAAKAHYEQEQEAAASAKGGEPVLPERPYLDNLERRGEDVRQGRDVTSQNFITDFGFRGVEFGNWVASDERQKIVNLAFEALHDLAGVVGVPPKALSLNGTLGLAFGSRGGGKALAHYESAKLVINMTKLRGAGALAHEWAHALDHYFGELGRADSYQGKPRGASGWYERAKSYDGRPISGFDRQRGRYEEMRLPTIRPEVAASFDRLMTSIFQRDRTKADVVRDRELALESAQGRLAEYQKRREAFKAADDKYRTTNKKYGESLEIGEKGTVDRIEALKRALDEARGDAFKPSGKVESSFYTNAKNLSGKSGEFGYWARPTEVFARSFEAFVFDQIAAESNRSDYLVQGVEADRYDSESYKGNPYPRGLEREAINAAFTDLFETIETQETETGVAMYAVSQPTDTMPPADSYVVRASSEIDDPLVTGHFLAMMAAGVDATSFDAAVSAMASDRRLSPADRRAVANAYTGGKTIGDPSEAVRKAFAERLGDARSAIQHGYSPEVAPSNLGLRPDLDRAMVERRLNEMSERLPKGVALVLRNAIRIREEGQTVALEGAAMPGSVANDLLGTSIGVSRKVLAISLEYGPDTAMRTFTHEEVHILRGLGVIGEAEWQVLSKMVTRKPKRGQAMAILDRMLDAGKLTPQLHAELSLRAGNLTYREIYRVDQRYGPYISDDALLIEETIAHVAADWSDGRQFSNSVERVMMKIRDFLEALQNALHGLGFRHANDIFESIWSGEMVRQFDAMQAAREAEAEKLDMVRERMVEDGVIAMAVGPRPAIEEVWGTKFQTLMSEQYQIAVAGEDIATQYDILSAKYNNALSDPPDMREAMKAEIDRLRPIVEAQEAELRADLKQRFSPDGGSTPPMIMFAFAGETAQTADRAALDRAQAMEATGSDRDAIWKETGWWRGVDGRWRFEIDDSRAKFRNVGPATSTLDRELNHGSLFDAYPEMEEIIIQRVAGSGGSFMPGGLFPDNIEVGRNASSRLSVVLHESQHAIQRAEDFAMGGSPRMFSRDEVASELSRIAQGDNGWTSVGTISGDDARGARYRLYSRLAGEVEARAVQSRMKLTPEQRTERAPWLDYDIPENQQIVRLAKEGALSEKSYSIEPPIADMPTMRGQVMFAIRAYHGSPHDFDQFRMDRIGTGEGAQAFGHGLYFAESEAVARSYRDGLEQAAAWRKPLIQDQASLRSVEAQLEDAAPRGVLGRWKIDKAERARLERRRKELQESIARAEANLNDPAKKGRMYEVSIKADPEDFLDWDKPLSQQSEKVKAALATDAVSRVIAGAFRVIDGANGTFGVKVPGGTIGNLSRQEAEQIVAEERARATAAGLGDDLGASILANFTGDKRAVSEALREAGIAGIRYLDQGSRTAGEGSRNFVVFSDDLIEIVSKDGVPMSAEDRADVVEAMRGQEAATERPSVMFSRAGDAAVGRSMRADLDSLGFYSKALDAARSWNQTKGTPEQALMWLKKSGVKDAEIEATGLKEFTDGKRSLTRDEVVAHLEASRISLNEVQRLTDRGLAAQRGRDYDRMRPDERDMLAMNPRAVKWQNYSLDHRNPTYRETVLHLPPGDAGMREARQPLMAEFRDLQDRGAGMSSDLSVAERARMEELRTQITQAQANENAARAADFRQHHFANEPNVIGHMMTSMVKHEGKPVHLLDQIQSDWGQKLRDGGVRDEAKIAELKQGIAAQQKNFDGAMEEASKLAGGKLTGESVRSWLSYATSGGRADIEDKARLLQSRINTASQGIQLRQAELRTTEAATPGNPLVNTTDQWVNTTLRRAITQAVEADAEFIAIPSGDTVLTYNPGDTDGMRGFYDGIVPKNLRNILRKLDKASPDPIRTDKLETPTQGMKGEGFTLFPLSAKVKETVKREGQPMFARRGPTPPQATEPGESPGLNKVISDLKKALGMTVSQGLWGYTIRQGARAMRIRPPSNVRGQMDRTTGNVSIRQSRDIKTLAHEGGHYLEGLLGTDLGAIKQRFAEALTGNPSPMPAALSEGFARWFESYILDPAAADRRAPGMAEAFDELLEAERPDMLAALDTVQQEYQRYITSAPLGEVAAGLSSQYDGTTWKDLAADKALDNISGKLSSAYQGAVDSLHVAGRGVAYLLKTADSNGIRDADGRPISVKVGDNFYKRLRLFAGAYGRGRAWLEKGVSDLETGRIIGPSLKAAMERAMGDGPFDLERYKSFNQYLVSIRAIAEYDRLDQKAETIRRYDDVLGRAAAARPQLADRLQKDRAALERREEAVRRSETLLRDRRRMLGNAETRLENIQDRLQMLRDDINEADESFRLAKDIGDPIATNAVTVQYQAMRVRRQRSLQVAERDQQQALRAVDALMREVDELGVDVAARRSEIAQIQQRVEGTSGQIAQLDEMVSTIRRERENASNRGASRPPTAEPRPVHERVLREMGSPEFQEAARMVHEFTGSLLEARRQAGFISQELYDELIKRKDWYVPFWRDMSDIDGAGSMFPGSGVKKWSMFKKFDGSDRSILMPLEVLSEEAYTTAQQIAFNDVVKTMVGLAERVGPGGARVAERLSREEQMVANADTFDRIRQMAVDLGVDQVDAHMLVQRMEMNFSDGDIRVIMSPENLGPTAKPQLPLWVNGERQMVRLPDPAFGRDLFDAMNGLGKEMGDILIKAMALPATALRIGVTSHPDFMFRNIWRDIWTAWKLTGAVPFVTQARGFKLIAEGGQVDGMAGEDFRRLYNEVGGVAGGMNVNAQVADQRRDVKALMDSNIDKKAIAAGAALGGFTGVAAGSTIGSMIGLVMGGPVGAGLGFKVGATIGGTIGGVGVGYAARHGEVWRAVEAVETATRLGVAAHAYKRARAHDPSLTEMEAMTEAAFVARDMLDWNRRGSKMLAVTRLVTFMNAQIQGLDKQLRQMRGVGDRNESVLRKHLAIVLKHQSQDILSKDEQRDLADAYKSYLRWGAITLMLMGLYALAGDDDDYQDIKDTTKWTHSWFKTLGVWFRLPKPFELGAPANVGEILWDKYRGYDQRAGARVVDSLYEVLAPPALPQVMRLTGGILFNRDRQGLFSGRSREVVGQNLMSRPPHERYHAFTSELAIDMARAIDSINRPVGRALENVPVLGKTLRNIVESTTPAPVKIDFVLSAAGAYWGREIQNAYQTGKTVVGMSTRPDRKSTDFPILRGFTGEAARQSQSVEEMFQMISREGGEMVMAATEYKQLLDDRGRPEEAAMWLKTLEPEQRVWALTQYYGSRSEKREHPLERARQADAINREIMRDTITDTLAPKRRSGRKQVRDFEERIELTPAKKTEVMDVLARLSQIEARNTMVLLKRPGFEGLSIKDPVPVLEELKAVSQPVHDLLIERRDKKVSDWSDVQSEWPKYRERVLREGVEAF